MYCTKHKKKVNKLG